MMNGNPAPFGALLIRFRAAAGLTQEQLAARAGLSRNAIAALERGRRHTPRGATAALLADALGLDDQVRTQFVTAARDTFGSGGTGGTAGTEGAGATERSSAAADAERGTGGNGAVGGGSAGSWRRQSWWLTGQATPLVDRVQELETILQRLRVEGVRLLTLVGPAGVGKTRLALAAAEQLAEDTTAPQHFPDGILLVDLTPIRDPALVLGAIARAMGLLDTGSRPLLERLVEALAERRRLVTLDNFEQVLPAATQLAELLAACPGLALLVTSRVPLRLRWEQTLRLAPLPVPDLRAALPSWDALLAVPSVKLFVERARARRADFTYTEKEVPMMAQLVVQLDGLPLALELAAARLDVLSLSVLTRRLGDRLQLLTSEAPDLPERQRSLEAAVGWSCELLSAPERRLFRCLGVFVGRVSLDAIAAVVTMVATTGPEAGEGDARDAGRTLYGLLSLAEKSLVLPLPVRPADLGWQHGRQDDQGRRPGKPGQQRRQVQCGGIEGTDEATDDGEDEEDPEPAFGMLETVREYAWKRLTALGELEAARRAHARYFTALAERADPLLHGCDQRAWYFRLEREHDNLRAALRWLLDQQDDPAEGERALRLAGALGWFWYARGYHAEGVRWLEEALARVPAAEVGEAEGEAEADPEHVTVRTRALVAAGRLLTEQSELVRARAVLEEALTLAERRHDSAALAEVHTYLGLGAINAGEVAEGTRLLQAALQCWEALGDPEGIGKTRFFLGYAADTTGDASIAASSYTDALQWLEAAGDAHLAGHVRCYLGALEWRRGDLPRAVAHVQAGMQTSVTLRDRWLLGFAAQATLALVETHAEPASRVRLLGSTDALVQATGANFAWERMPVGSDAAGLRERLAREAEEELAVAYRDGRALPFGEMAALALRLLDEAARAQPQADRAPGGTKRPAQPPPSQRAERNTLSARELEVLRLVAQGLSSKTIGRQLFLAPSTVNYYLTSVFHKLGVDTRAQAVAVAAQRGLL